MNELALMVNTTRFGDLEVAPEDVLHFPDGLIGLAGNDYALVPATRGPFIWLQSLADLAVALPLTEPDRFFPDFRLELGDAEAHLEIDPAEARQVFVTVRAAATAADCTANLKAPIVVLDAPGSGGRRAHQVLNHAPGAVVRAPLFPAL